MHFFNWYEDRLCITFMKYEQNYWGKVCVECVRYPVAVEQNLVWRSRWKYFSAIDVQYIPRIINMVYVLLCFAVLWYWQIMTRSFRVSSLALGQSYDCPLGQSYDCPSARKVNVKDKGKINQQYKTTIKHTETQTVCVIVGMYYIDGLMQERLEVTPVR